MDTLGLSMKVFKLSFIIALCMFCSGTGFASVGDELQYKNGMLSIDVREAPLKKILVDISEKAGVEIYVFSETGGAVTARFTEKTLQAGLSSILKGYNFAVIFSEKGDSCGVRWIKPFNVKNGKTSGSRHNGAPNNGALGRKGVNTSDDVASTDDKEDESITEDGSLSDDESTTDNEGAEEEVADNSDDETSDMPSWYYEGISTEEAKLQYRIDVLEEQIESGYADKQYDNWSEIKGEDYIAHASYYLEKYEEQLEELTSE